MHVKQVIKTERGEYTFQGELSQEEFDFIFGAGMGYLLETGAMVLAQENDEEELMN